MRVRCSILKFLAFAGFDLDEAEDDDDIEVRSADGRWKLKN